METYFLDQDQTLFYVAATSFPDGIKAAYQALDKVLADSAPSRIYWGISFPNEKGEIIYKAAVAELYAGEAQAYNLPTFFLKKGSYTSQMIYSYMDKIHEIGTTFEQLLKNPAIDPEGCCVEMYLNDKELRCMVRLKEE